MRGQWAESGCAEAVVRINRTVCQNVPSNKYVTFFLARLDPATGSLCYVNAGHNPPLLLRADGGLERLSEGGMVLGLFDSVPYAEGSVTMKRGDVLVIYSDGVTEAWSESGAEFGEANVARVAGENRHEAAAAIHERLLAAVDTYDCGKAADDRTLIVLKRD